MLQSRYKLNHIGIIMKKCKSLRIEESTIKRVEEMARLNSRSFNNMVEVILAGYAADTNKKDGANKQARGE